MRQLGDLCRVPSGRQWGGRAGELRELASKSQGCPVAIPSLRVTHWLRHSRSKAWEAKSLAGVAITHRVSHDKPQNLSELQVPGVGVSNR